MSDADWLSNDLGIAVDSPTLVYPPRWGVIAMIVIALIGLGMVLINPRIGYLVAVVASSVGGFTAASDQKRRADSNYAAYTWFMPMLRVGRYFSLVVAVVNITVLAVEVARGGSII